ncbi:MAG: DUF4870 domain-containing protein [Chitinophagaceae bacterium]|nr:DUF4870 domain-containing protein [Chitinophagaceae bacterium]
MNEQTTSSFLGSDEPALIPPTSDEKTMAILSHILTLIAGFIAPLVIYLLKKDSSTFIADHAKESLNFQITLFIAFVISVILWVILIGLLLTWLIGIAALVLIIIATIRASEGKLYRYPFAIRLIK